MTETIVFWRTWDGRMVDFLNINHQHLSNIHYYQNLIHPELYPKSQKEFIRTLLLHRFGRILPYHPHPNFMYEREMLSKLGYLKNNVDIVVHGQKIGSYE